MRLLTLCFSLLLLVLLMFAPVQPIEATTINGTLTLINVEDNLNTCNLTPPPYIWPPSFFIYTVATGLIANDTDFYDFNGEASDGFYVVIYDAYGNPIAGGLRVILQPQTIFDVGIRTQTYPDADILGWVSPQARPFIAKAYDTNFGYEVLETVWDVLNYPEIAVSAPYDPSTDAPACAGLPIGDPYNFIVGPPTVVIPDLTSQTGITSSATDLAMYLSNEGDGLDLYGINAESDGYFLGTITQEMIAPYAENPPEDNTLIESFGDNVNVYVLTTGEIQINVGPNEEGKTFVYVFDGIPWTSITTYVIDPPSPE